MLATIVLYYTYLHPDRGDPEHPAATSTCPSAFYVGIVIVSNLIGAFASLPASQTDRLGRTNVVIYGLLIVGLLVAVGVPNVRTEWGFAIVICGHRPGGGGDLGGHPARWCATSAPSWGGRRPWASGRSDRWPGA